MDEVRRFRKERGLTQVELAELAGVSAFTVTEIETGRREPRPSTLRKLARVLDVEVADFFREPALPKDDGPPSSGRHTNLGPYLSWRFFIEQTAEDYEQLANERRLNADRYDELTDEVTRIVGTVALLLRNLQVEVSSKEDQEYIRAELHSAMEGLTTALEKVDASLKKVLSGSELVQAQAAGKQQKASITRILEEAS